MLTIIHNDSSEKIVIDGKNSITIKKVNGEITTYACTFNIAQNISADAVIVIIRTAKDLVTKKLQALGTQAIIQWDDGSEQLIITTNTCLAKLELTRKMHEIIRSGSFKNRVEYLGLVGLRPEICRQQQFRDAENHYKFQRQITRLGIPINFCAEEKSKRIHAVNPHYVEFDEEVREGLKVTAKKHHKDHPIFVSNEDALMHTLEQCAEGTTLVIDGHWIHGKSATFGVWEQGSAETMAGKITNVVNAFSGKVKHINILGCESGELNPQLDRTINNKGLHFKYDNKPILKSRPMAEFRNRAVYVSETGESVFHPDSLAFHVLVKLADPEIAVTAVPSIGYPFPPESPNYNIGSDAKSWKGEQHWLAGINNEPTYDILRQTKSITQINKEQEKTHSKRPWGLRA